MADHPPGPARAPVGPVAGGRIRRRHADLLDRARELERAHASLAESERRFRSMAEAAPVGIFAGEGPGQRTYANRRFAEICGLPDDDRLRPAFAELVHPDDRAGLSSASTAALAGQEQGGALRTRVARPAGGVRWVDIHWVPLPAKHRAGPRFVATMHDVTELVEAEAQKEAVAVRLQVAERLEGLGQLAGGIAHDFNNLLTVIMNSVSFAREALAADTATTTAVTRVRHDIATIRRAAERAAALTHQLLLFGRRAAERTRTISPGAAVGDLAKLLQRTIGEHVTLDIRAGDDLWPVLVDPTQFEQVVVNLVVNARDAIIGTGRVVVALDNLEIDEAAAVLHDVAGPGSYVRLAVVDTGSGMAPEVAARAFEPFFTTKSPGQGTGLGLSTVYGIARQWGGAAGIYSERGKGTSVRVYIPRAAGEAGPLRLEQAPLRAGQGELVLVVEDQEAVLDATRRILLAGGYQVAAAGSGRAALDLLERLDPGPAVLLSDVEMPGMSGVDLVDRALALHPSLGVVFMSGYPASLAPGAGAPKGGVALVDKPFTRRSLLEAVGAAVARPST